jgi:hypothetical protein
LFSVIKINYLKVNIMDGLLDINSPKFLGGNNVHNVITIGLLGLLVYKQFK